MRLLLLIMTGIGFTLGLLCGLLLHLPADGLPANTNDHIISDSSNFRSRRSFSDGGGDDSALVDPATVQQSEKSQSSSRSRSPEGSLAAGLARRPSFQSPPNPKIGSNPFVSSGRANNNGEPQSRPIAGLSGRGSSRAEPSDSSVKSGEGKEKNGGQGREKENPSLPDHPTSRPASGPDNIRPVTSFTLRLKNTGKKFVVDSAVKRQEDENIAVVKPPAPAGHSDLETQTSTQNDGTKVKPFSVTSNNKTSSSALGDIVSGVLWSRRLEDSCPQRFEPKEIASWRRKAVGMRVVGMEEGCGRMQNRLVIFKDGSQACARYRLNTDQIQGEVYSYYLAQVLNITNLPPAVMLPVNSLSPQWKNVHLEMSMAQWADARLVVLTRWLHDLQPSFIPQELREDDRKLHPTLGILGKKSVEELCDLLQWSDLIVFDYLTANLDRLVNNMFNRQWNAEMMNNPAHNLERTKDGSLVFLDNESGLFHGYRLLEKYHGYHESLLNSMCVFRESTAKAVKVLHRSKSVGDELQKLFTEGEIHHKHLPSIPEKNVNVLKDRLARVYEQIVKCEELYAR